MKSTEYMLYKSVNLFGGLVIRVVPYYVEVIQAELGALYIRHKLKEKLKDKEKQDKFIKNIID